jgi:hypothetical protein
MRDQAERKSLRIVQHGIQAIMGKQTSKEQIKW